MFAGQLIGKLAIRTNPVDRGEHEVGGFGSGIITRNIDNSFTNSPIIILAATENHIVYLFSQEHDPWLVDNGRRHVLNYEYCDDNWTSYDDLMILADNAELMRKLQE